MFADGAPCAARSPTARRVRRWPRGVAGSAEMTDARRWTPSASSQRLAARARASLVPSWRSSVSRASLQLAHLSRMLLGNRYPSVRDVSGLNCQGSIRPVPPFIRRHKDLILNQRVILSPNQDAVAPL